MKFNCGIVGLPNVGKSTLFSALTAAPAEAANYPFCTIDPNVGVVSVPDSRLDRISELVKPKQTIPTIVEFVDIAGLVKGASKGEGLGNQFLGNIREVGAIVHVVRCFDDSNIVHVEGNIDPIRDIATIELELAYADLETVNSKLQKISKSLRSSDKKLAERAKVAEPLLHQFAELLDAGKPARSLELTDEQNLAVNDLHLITRKEQIYCCNVDENSLDEDNKYVKQVKEYAAKNNSEVLVISAKLESEISELESDEEKREFLSEAGLDESGLDKLIKTGYKILGLETFFTAGEKECRAWTFNKASTAPQAAAVIHTDFQKGFIKAEVYHCEDLFKYKTEAAIKEAGKLRIEGKEYIVKDGDVMHFRFNV